MAAVLDYVFAYFWYILILVVFLINLIIAVIVRNDAKKHNLGPKLWFIFCIVGGFFGLFIYLSVKRKHVEAPARAQQKGSTQKTTTGRVAGP